MLVKGLFTILNSKYPRPVIVTLVSEKNDYLCKLREPQGMANFDPQDIT
jgi:hypothetical protein